VWITLGILLFGAGGLGSLVRTYEEWGADPGTTVGAAVFGFGVLMVGLLVLRKYWRLTWAAIVLFTSLAFLAGLIGFVWP
jgi:hypothetical protein